MEQSSWDFWVEEALLKLESLKLLRPIRPIQLSKKQATEKKDDEEYEVFNELQPWDRSTVEVSISESFFQQWLRGDNEVLRRDDLPVDKDNANQQKLKKLVLFCGNDFLGLSSHPTIAKATAKDCLLCPTGYAANTALMVAIGSIAPLLAAGKKPSKEEKIAIFSDALNHLSIIEGIYLAGRRGGVELFVYRHCDMSHLNELLTSCKMKKKVVVTDSLFSMDGDFAPMLELAELRKKHGFLLVIDDAHATFVCGENGGGVAEKFNCETDVDICTGSLSKAAATLGGFIACSKKWKQFIQSRGRAFIFSTTAPVPFTSALHAAVIVARKETWRRKAIQERMREFHALTGIPITSHIISIVVRTEEKAVQASRYMVKSGFYVTPIRPPGVSPDSCRLRVTLTAAHTTDDIKRLAAALSNCISFQDISSRHSNLLAKL
ncbi:Aminotransferase [Theobroma cacao]|nr:Aminotransferase [Theobroma cacao]